MIQKLCRQRGISISELLSASATSRNAYYSLSRKESVIPKSLQNIAKTLGVAPSSLLHDKEKVLSEHMKILQRVNEIVERDSSLDPNEVRHILLLLQEPAINRLKRGIRRGRLRSARG